jgi:uncharacterized protein
VHSSFRFELKSASDDGGIGRFVGLASVFGNVDLGGDVVMPGAFERTLREKGPDRPLLWQHSIAEPIGLVHLREVDEGLEARGEIDLNIDAGRRAYSGLKRKYLRGLSIGFNTTREVIGANGANQLHEVDLWEVSIVTFPANIEAGVRTVKRDGDEQLTEDEALPLLAHLTAVRRETFAWARLGAGR